MICAGLHSGLAAALQGFDPSCGEAPPTVLPPDAFDGPNGVRRPYCREHFGLIGPGFLPAFLFPLQELAGAGQALDVCNSPAGALNAANVTFGATIPGWAGKFASVGSEANANSLSAEISTLWNCGNSSLVIGPMILTIRSSSGGRSILVAGGNGGLQIQCNGAGNIVCWVGGATAGTVVYESLTPTPFSAALVYDRRGAGAAAVVTNREIVSRAFVNYSDDRKAAFGCTTRPTIASPIMDIGSIPVFTGLTAEALIDYGVKDYINIDLGWPT